MKLTACIITLKENLVPKGATTEQPAWLRAKASITLDNKITLHGLVIRDVVANSGVFVTYPKLPVLTDQYEITPKMKMLLEPEIIFAYQKARYPWINRQNIVALHPLTLEILSGLREFYDYAADLHLGQRDVNNMVIKLLGKKTDWGQNDYEKIKSKVEPILQKIQDTIPD